MNNQITDKLQSFLKDYAADSTPRDFAIAQHFYNLALEDVKKELERRYNDNLEAADMFAPNSYSRGLFSLAAKEDFDIVSFIDNQKR